MMDTKNFTFQNRSKNILKRQHIYRKCGVDIIHVKKNGFQSDLESFNKIAEIVGKAEIINDTYSHFTYDEKKQKT